MLQYPDDYINKVICGDCLEVMKGIPDNSVDLIVTDPPYGTVDGRGKVWHGDKKFDPGEWDQKLPLDYIVEAIRVLKDGHWWFIFSDSLSLNKVWDKVEQCGGRGKEVFVWIKSTFSPQPRKNFCSAFEAAVVGTKGAVKVWYGGGHTPNYFSTTPAAFESINSLHPTQKPLRLISYLIDKMSKSNDLILDPFLGSGTTAVAAQKLGRRFIGIEIDPKYCEIARKRLEFGRQMF